MDHLGRLQRLELALERNHLDALVVSHLPNIRYLCGFTGTSGVLLVGLSGPILVTDGRYREQAKNELRGAGSRISPKPALDAAAERLRRARRRSLRIGIEPTHMTVAARAALAKALGRRAKIIAAPQLVEDMRMIKDAEEIANIRSACRLGAELFRQALARVRPGIAESQIAGELEFRARRAGVEQMAFPTIVAAGRRSALPHGRASSALIPRRGFVVCDFGVILAGYCSDMTRTVHVGRPSGAHRDGYGAVLEAQQAALEAVRPGVAAAEIDRAARRLLGRRKLARFFTHATGHGTGLEIHEAPRIGARQKQLLRAGMVITVEPGVYVPGAWGVRIEDTVVVTETGCEILTACPKDLVTL
jgi:Xaa-Pro aminopeptidase